MATKSLFGTSGARGVTNKEITPQLAMLIAMAYGSMMKSSADGEPPRVLVGHDQRLGAGLLAQTVAIGFQSVGIDVHTIGMVSTGMYSAFMRGNRFDGGILVTGSHMPPDRIGIIPMLQNAHYADQDVTDQIEMWMKSWNSSQRPTPRSTFGELIVRERHDVMAVYRYTLQPSVPISSGKRKFRRIVVDPGNGTGGFPAEQMLHGTSWVPFVINGDPQSFPNRPSECNPTNCAEAIRCVVSGRAHLGVCFDGDADRVKFITHKGIMLEDSVVAAIFARHVLDSGDTVVTGVNASGLIEAIAKEKGLRVEYCRIGQPSNNMAARMYKAAFAFEEAAGKFGFRDFGCCFDGSYAMLRMLQIMDRTGKSLADLAGEVPKFYQSSARIPVADAAKDRVVRHAREQLERELGSEILRTDTTDGTKWFLEGDQWLMIRPSGTEPVVRAYADGRSQLEVDILIGRATDAFERASASVG